MNRYVLEDAVGITFMVLMLMGPLLVLAFMAAKVGKNAVVERVCSVACVYALIHMCGLAVWYSTDELMLENNRVLPHNGEVALLLGTIAASIMGSYFYALWLKRKEAADTEQAQADAVP